MPKITIGQQEIAFMEEGTGEALFMFPDNIHSSLAFREEFAYFSKDYRVLSFDYPGSGRSSRQIMNADERTYDLWNYYADFACHLLMAQNITKCYAMGVSEGALAALQFAGRQARLHKIETLGVIADSFLCNYDTQSLHRLLDAREHYYVRHSKELQEQHGEDWRQVVDADTAALRKLADHGGYELPECVLKTIVCPVLLTGNLRDTLTPGIALEYARISAIIPKCSVYLASESGDRYGHEHPLMWTAPTLFRAVASLFFSAVN